MMNKIKSELDEPDFIEDANIATFYKGKGSRTEIINDRGIHICKSLIAWNKFGNNSNPKNDNIKGIILCGEGRTFFAGADISEFGKPMQSPSLNEVILDQDL